MAAASDGLRNSFLDLFSHRGYIEANGNSYYGYGSIRSTNAFSHFLEVPITRNHIEFPIWAKNNVEQRIGQDTKYPSITTPLENVIIPLYCKNTIGTVKTADSMLKKFFTPTHRVRLLKATNGSDDNIYYGNRGIVLDKDFKVLMCLYLTADYDEENKRWKYGQPVLKVSSWVFEYPQEFMSKAIIQKIIPLCMKPCSIYNNENQFTSAAQPRCKVIIDDYSKLVVKPAKPSPNHCSNEVLNQVLLDNINEILSLVP